MIAAFAISLVAIAGFAVVLVRTDILGVARRLMDQAMAGISAMLDSALDDAAKERAVRGAGLALIRCGAGVAWRFALALAAAYLPLWLADAAGLVPLEAVLGLMLRLDYIIGVTVLAVLAGWALKRLRGTPEAPDQTAYGFGDRFIHMLAFSGPGLQKAAAWLDDRLFARRIARLPDTPPIFVTSLARGGTTALLNAFNDMPGIATHRYRDMPFITAPLIWSRLSGAGARKVTRRKRAHGDGLEIDLNSPEAFDEVFWKLHWPEKYQPDRIALWQTADAKPEAQGFFARHFRKIRLLRGAETGRYLSKNNANIARLRLLPQMFPGCDVVIPLRRPEAHAASLLRQHHNFVKQQGEDEFIRRYMRDIGHLEFGLLHKPIGFDGFASDHPADTPDYWLTLWIAAFRDVLAQGQGCHIVTQDDLRAAPQQTMQALTKRLQIDVGGMDFTGYFRAVPDKRPADLYDPALLAEAHALYDQLAARAIRATPRAAGPPDPRRARAGASEVQKEPHLLDP